MMDGWQNIFSPIAFLLWLFLFRILALSLFTFFLVVSSQRLSLVNIEESFSGIRLHVAAIASISWVLLLIASSVVTKIGWGDLFPKNRWFPQWASGAFQGMATALAIFSGLYFSGHYRYMGFLVHFEEGPWAVLLILIRAAALFLLVYSEEFWIRGWILKRAAHRFHPAVATVGAALLSVIVKEIYFDLGILQSMTVFLISLWLGLRFLRRNHWLDGAGRLFGLLFVWHSLLGFPIFGSEFSGTFLMRYFAPVNPLYFGTLLTGGAAGPLSSLLVQGIVILACLREVAEAGFRKRLLSAKVAA